MLTSSIAPVAAGIIRRKRLKIFLAFRTNVALSQNSARSLSGLGIEESRFLASLIRHRIIRSTVEGKYYLDETALEEFHQRRHKLLVIPLATFAVAMLLLLWWVAFKAH
jgi:hypothetical protein